MSTVDAWALQCPLTPCQEALLPAPRTRSPPPPPSNTSPVASPRVTTTPYTSHRAVLGTRLAAVQDTSLACSSVLTLLHRIQHLHTSITESQTSMREQCAALVTERDRLVASGTELATMVGFFTDAKRLRTKLCSSRFSPALLLSNAEDFVRLWTRVTECRAFMTAHIEAKEAPAFLKEYSSLHKMASSLLLTCFACNIDSSVTRGITGTVHLRSIGRALAPALAYVAQEHPSVGVDLQSRYIATRTQVPESPSSPLLSEATRDLCLATVSRIVEEHSLFLELFYESSDALAGLLARVAGSLTRLLRPRIISEWSLDEVCTTCHVLVEEVLDAQVYPRGAACQALVEPLERVLEDSQERLVYLAELLIRDEVLAHTPSAADLDYPAVLEASSSRTWYPTVELVLVSLSKLYSVLDKSVFTSLAYESVNACVESLQKASARLPGRVGLLFLIRSLVILREQINPFDVFFSVSESALEFEGVGGVLSRLIGGKLELVDVRTSQVDSKKQLDQVLQRACELYITEAAGLVLGDHTLQGIVQGFPHALDTVVHEIALYLGPATQRQLFAPIRARVLLALEEVRKETLNTEIDTTALNPLAIKIREVVF